MVIDSSIIVAILFGEADADHYGSMIEADPTRLMSAASILEVSLVIENELGDAGEREMDLLMHRIGIEAVAFNQEQLKFARHAFRKYGKGRHPAGLNFGDCFSYALSRTSGEPLLFKGDDFSKTDVTVCP